MDVEDHIISSGSRGAQIPLEQRRHQILQRVLLKKKQRTIICYPKGVA
jgi:hypothetical protein